MPKRAAAALRILAVLELILVARLLVIGVLRDAVLVELRSGKSSSTLLFEKLKHYSDISLYSHVTILIVALLAILFFARALRRGGGWAFAAGGVLALHLVLLVVERTLNLPDKIPAWVKGLWWADGMSLGVGLALPLVAALRAVPGRLARIGVAGAGVIVVVDGGVSAFGLIGEVYPPWLQWVERGIALASAAWFASMAFPLAKRLARGDNAEPGAAQAAGAMDGGPLRMLAWALLARIAAGIVLQVLLLVSMFGGEYQSAGSLTTLGAAVGVLISVVIFVALVQYLGFPTTHRSESLIVAMGLLVLGIGLEVYAASAASKLFDLVGEAKRATSFWSMPSLTEIESLQTTLTWAGRGGIVLGIVAGLALVGSLRVTAQALGASEQVARANRVVALLVTAAIGIVVVGFLTEVLKRDAAPMLLVFALALLFVAIVLMTNWMQLLFGLAAELERGPTAPLAEPSRARIANPASPLIRSRISVCRLTPSSFWNSSSFAVMSSLDTPAEANCAASTLGFNILLRKPPFRLKSTAMMAEAGSDANMRPLAGVKALSYSWR